MIAECKHCRTLINYKTSSDLLDGHNCPERRAAQRPHLRRVGGPVGDEVYSESQMERESLDNSEPPDEGELADVDYSLSYCRLCSAQLPKSRWDARTNLVCTNCGAIYPGSAA